MSQLDIEQVKRHVAATQNVYVSTMNEQGYPITRVMFNLHNPQRCPKQAAFLAGLEDFHIYLGTNAASSKVAQLRNEPRVSLYFHVPDSWQGMLVAGEAEVVTDVAIRHGLWQDEWSMYYQGGVDGDDYTIVRVRPVFAEYYHDLSKETRRFA